MKRLLNKLILLLIIMNLLSNNQINAQEKSLIKYPFLKPDNDTKYNYSGVNVTDPYRVLENLKDQEVIKWFKAQKELSDSVLSYIPKNDSIKNILEKHFSQATLKSGMPRTCNKKLFFIRVFSKERITKLIYRADVDSSEVELFSTAQVNETGINYSIKFYEPSFDGKYIAFGLASNGADNAQIYILEVGTKKIISDRIERCNYGTPMWIQNLNAFFYMQLNEGITEEEKNAPYTNAVVKLHYIGQPSETDRTVFSKKGNPYLNLEGIDIPVVCTFPDSKYVIAYTTHGSNQYLSLYVALLKDILHSTKEWKWKQIFNGDELITHFTLKGEKLVYLSFKNNSNGSLFSCKVNNPLKNSLLLDAKNEMIEEIIQNKDCLFIKKIKNGSSALHKYDFESEKLSEVQLPYSGNIILKAFFSTPPFHLYSKDLFFSMEAYNHEIGIFQYNSSKNCVTKTTIRPESKLLNFDDIIIDEIEVSSHDGELVPLSIIRSRKFSFDGNNPTILEAYGAYGISMKNSFDLALLSWVKLGGIYAIAHVRGGSEKGNNWYKGGFKENKPNSWKDFISCAEFLIAKNYTSKLKLAAKSSSAGCITTGRAITERPDLFKTAILEVGSLNALRFENTKNNIGVSEFGSNKDSIGAKNLYEMDVYHHIKTNIAYPSLLFTASMNDSRVDAWQPAKAVAKFQEVSWVNNNLVLFKVNEKSGHSGDPDKIRKFTEYFNFLFWQLNSK